MLGFHFRLKQMQKAASLERKTILKEQRNLIRHQLSTDTMLSKMKVTASRERRLSGPLKVIQSHSESIRSETSVSKRSSSEKDVYSITSHTQSIVSKVSEISVEELASKDLTSDVDHVIQATKLAGDSGMPVSQMKKTLLMREAALQKRRKAAEELLRWHKKLLEEERRITELESSANAIISHIPSNVSVSSNVANKYKFKGKQLNQLWFNLTGCEEKKFSDDKVYPMSQISLERFCKSAKEYSTKTKKLLRKVSDSEINSEYSGTRTDDSVSEHIPELKDLSASTAAPSPKKTSSKNNTISTARTNDYASDFDVESIQDIVGNKDMDVVDQSLNQLIDNFAKIEADLASLGIEHSLKSNEDDSPRSENTGSDIEVSVIETTKTSRDEKSEPEKITVNLSIIEEINKSTRDTLDKSEQVLLKLNQAEESIHEDIRQPGEVIQKPSSEEKTKSTVSEIISQAKSSISANKRSEKLKESENGNTSTIIYSKVSQRDETAETLNKAREILEKLSQTEDLMKTADSKSSLTVDDLASSKTIDNLSKTEEILERLSLTDTEIKSKLSSDKKSPVEGNVVSETTHNLNKTQEILENLSLLDNKLASDSSNKKSSILEIREAPTDRSHLTITEEILPILSTKNKEITADNSPKEISREPSVIEESQVFEDNECLIEGSNSKLNQVEASISSDIGVVTSDKESIVEEGEEPLLELSPAENLDIQSKNLKNLEENYQKSVSENILKPTDLSKSRSSEVNSKSLSKIPSIPEDESPTDINIESILQIDGKISTVAIEEEILSTESSKSSKIPSSENNNGHILEDSLKSANDLFILASVAQSIAESKRPEEISESPKETYVDEELFTDEQKLDEESKVEEVIEISDNEEPSINEEATSTKSGKNEISANEELSINEETAPTRSGRDEISVNEERSNNEETAPTKSSRDKSTKEKSEDVEEGVSSKGENIEEFEINKDTQTSSVRTESSISSHPKSSCETAVSKSTKEDIPSRIPSDIPVDIEASDKSHITESLPSEDSALSKEDINSYEEKEQDSLSSSTSSSCLSAKNEKSDSDRSKSSVPEEKSPRNGTVDVKKRVSEIMADASQSPRGDKSPRVQDLYVTTYDLVSPANSPELGSPVEGQRIITAKSIFGTEAEEILRKQLAIEQEIKLITEQQQKEHIPYMYVREIPNKPPPPYTPPSSLPPANVITIIPTTQEVEEITKFSAKILHKAYLSNTLDNISISDTTLGLISKDITKECYKFIFDICKEITRQHYKQFEKEKCVSWLQMRKRPQLAETKPLDVGGLERHLNRNLKELFGYEKPNRRENSIIKWSRKKRDHVDEILVIESQTEESQWTNYEKDELLVMNEVTNEIMNMLLKETGEVFIEILSKRT